MGNQTAEGSHSIFDLYNGSQWLPSTHFLQDVFFCVQQKNETLTGLEQVEGENDDCIFVFGWTIPLRDL